MIDAWPKRVRGESEIGALQVRLHSTTRSVDLVPADSVCRIAPDNLPCHQPAQTALVDGANLDLRSAPLRRSTYPLPSYLLFALTSEPTGQQDATSSGTLRLHTDFIFDSHPPIP